MITFIKILLLGKVMLLTPEPTSFENRCVEILLDDPVKAITSGASIQIDVSEMFSWKEGESIKGLRSRIARAIPTRSISADLYSLEGEGTRLLYYGHQLISRKDVVLSLQSSDGVPIDRQFQRVKVCTDLQLTNVKILWKNYQH